MTTQNDNNGLTKHIDAQQEEEYQLQQQQYQQQQQQQQQQQYQQQQQQQYQQQQMQMCSRERPPAQIMRPARVSRHFKNPPQPHMCIKDYTHDGQELFINVMSWTKICMPQNATDPIPLYGGMRVHSGSPRSPPLVYAVMANPDILKHVGRKCSDAEERVALVELMCDFVEAMNPGLKLQRDAEVLKDRDLSGELKDIWGAVQAKREREKDPQANYFSPSHNSNDTIYIEFGPETSQDRRTIQQNCNNLTDDELHHLTNTALNISYDCPNQAPPPSYDAIRHDKIITMPKQHHIDVIDSADAENITNGITVTMANAQVQNGPGDHQSSVMLQSDNMLANVNVLPVVQGHIPDPTPTPIGPAPLAIEETDSSPDKTPTETTVNEVIGKVPSETVTLAIKSTTTNDVIKPIETQQHIETITNKSNPAASIPSSTKKEKVGGFLPNSCHNIFPFMKSKLNNDKKQQKDKIIMNSKDDLSKNNKKSMKLKDEQNKIELMNATDLKMHN